MSQRRNDGHDLNSPTHWLDWIIQPRHLPQLPGYPLTVICATDNSGGSERASPSPIHASRMLTSPSFIDQHLTLWGPLGRPARGAPTTCSLLLLQKVTTNHKHTHSSDRPTTKSCSFASKDLLSRWKTLYRCVSQCVGAFCTQLLSYKRPTHPEPISLLMGPCLALGDSGPAVHAWQSSG